MRYLLLIKREFTRDLKVWVDADNLNMAKEKLWEKVQGDQFAVDGKIIDREGDEEEMIIQTGKILQNIIQKSKAEKISYSLDKDNRAIVEIKYGDRSVRKTMNIVDFEDCLVDTITEEIIRGG